MNMPKHLVSLDPLFLCRGTVHRAEATFQVGGALQ